MGRQREMLGRRELLAGSPNVDWLIDGVLPVKRRALLYADSGVGKSLVALDIGLHVATGLPWQGRAIKQGTVYYLAAENQDTFNGPVQAWEKEYKGFERWEKQHPEKPDAPFFLDTATLDLSNSAIMDALLNRLGPAQLVVIDTLLAALGSLDVKDTNQSYQALAQINRIIERTGANVLLVHHTPDKGVNPLGGAPWRGGIQTRMYLTRQRNGRNVGEDGDFQDGDTITLACKKLTGARQFSDIVLPVRLVTPKGAQQSIPVLASEKGQRRSRHASPALRLVPTRSPHAERQARYRQKHAKKACVTPCDAVMPLCDAA
jgi:RecA-family ATPase